MSVLSRTACAALDRMDEIANVWKAISDLTCSTDDLHTVDRDNLGCALDFLCREYAAARNRFSEACQEAQS